MIRWQRNLTRGVLALSLVVGLGGPALAKSGPSEKHDKLDKILKSRAGKSGTSRVIITLQSGADPSSDVRKLGGRLGRKLGLINGQVVELPNAVLRKLADLSFVESVHYDRPTGGEMNRVAVATGARAAQSDLRVYRRRRRRRGHRLGRHHLARRPDLPGLVVGCPRQERAARRRVRRLRQRPDGAVRRQRPRHARRRHHRRQRLRLARRARRHRAGGAHRQPEGARRPRPRRHQRRHRGARVGGREQGRATTSASSTCRSARRSPSPTRPTR